MLKNLNKKQKYQNSAKTEEDNVELDEDEQDELEEVEESAEDEEEDDSAEGAIEEFDVDDLSSTDGEEDLDENDEDQEEADEKEEEEAADPVELNRDKIRNNIQQRYEKVKGKRLYLRFAEKLPPEDDKLLEKVQALSPLITGVRRPRQKSAHFCLLTVDSEEDCEKVFETITNIIKTSKDTNLQRMHVSHVRTDSGEYVEQIAERRIKALEAKKAKRKLKKAQLNAAKAGKFTSTLIVTNLPQRTSMLELRTAFPKAIDVRIKRHKAAVTFPNTFEARNAYKKPTSLAGLLLKVRFDKPRKRKPKIKKEQQQDEETGKKAKKRTSPKTEEEMTLKKKKKKTKVQAE